MTREIRLGYFIVILMRAYTYIQTCIHTYIYLDLDVKMKSSMFGNNSLGSYSMGNRFTGQILEIFCGVTAHRQYTNHFIHLG